MQTTAENIAAGIGHIFGGRLLSGPTAYTGNCPEHGEYHTKQFVKDITPECPRCLKARAKAESQAYQREMADHNRRQAEALRRQALCEQTDIPPRFADKTVKDWLPETDSEKVIFAGVVSYAQHLRTGGYGSLVMHGNVGTGKTHLACALLSMAKRDLGQSVQYLTVGDLFRKLRQSKNFKAAANESEVLEFYESFDLLVVDEVGNQSGSDAERVMLCDIINRRYAAMKPTIVISNLPHQALVEFLGVVAWERLLDGGVQLEFDGQSRRKSLTM